MQFIDDVSFEIYFGKIGEIKFPKNHSGIFWQNFPRFFFWTFWKIMIGVELLSSIFQLHTIQWFLVISYLIWPKWCHWPRVLFLLLHEVRFSFFDFFVPRNSLNVKVLTDLILDPSRHCKVDRHASLQFWLPNKLSMYRVSTL